MSRDGRAITLTTPYSSAICGRLYDFDVGEASLKPAHVRWVLQEVVPLLNAHGSVSVRGQASRTGGGAFNRSLSRLRADSVLRFLRENTRGAFTARRPEWQGEEAAAAAGQRDNTEDDWYRAVVVCSSSRPAPPTADSDARPQRNIQRILYRSFGRHKVTRDVPGRDQPDAVEPLLDLGLGHLRDWLFSSSTLLTVGSEVSRRTTQVPADHAVNEVHVLVEYERSIGADYELEQWNTSYLYTYGPPASFVVVRRSTIIRSFVQPPLGEARRIYAENPQPPGPPETTILSRQEAAEAMLIIPPEPGAPMVR